MSEGFASRWSRVKREREAGIAVQEPLPVVPPTAAATAHIVEAETQAVVDALPPVETLTTDSDFAAFMQPKVPDALKRQAVKQLFKDPHFNKMDGLDVYIDDYNTFTPIPEDWYKDIPSWQKILNPTQPLDTGKGYFVEPDSEEGKAILAAREEAQAQAQAAANRADPPSDVTLGESTDTASDAATTGESSDGGSAE